MFVTIIISLLRHYKENKNTIFIMFFIFHPFYTNAIHHIPIHFKQIDIITYKYK